LVGLCASVGGMKLGHRMMRLVITQRWLE